MKKKIYIISIMKSRLEVKGLNNDNALALLNIEVLKVNNFHNDGRWCVMHRRSPF